MAAKKAIVLAAGLGTRLRPLTCATPKPLLPVWGEPMLARIVEMLRGWGVDDIVVNCHYLHEQVEAWCAANGCRASYEPEILGTGGVLNPLREWIGGDDFYLVNGDIVLEGVEKPLAFKRAEAADPGVIGRCLITEDAGPRTVEADPEGNITCWRSPDPGFPGTYTYCGVALLKPAILDYVEPSGFSTIVQAYERAMMEGRFVRGLQPKELLWTDAGTIQSYIDVNCDGDDNAFADIPQLKAVGAKDVKFLGARGSDRCFFEADGRIVIVYDDSKRAENARYAGHARWLAEHGARVPKILDDRPDIKTLVMEHGGAERKMTLEDYVKVVEALARFGSLDASSLELEPPFDAALWRWERDLFKEHCLGSRFAMECDKAVEDELCNVASLLEREPRALVHRDFQSTNVLWKNGEPVFIDFQGMRLGPAAYDLASLLYDPYVSLTEGERRALAKLYAKVAGREEIVKVLPFAAVQRLAQCLGAYGRLASVGQPQFGKYVMPALENLLAAADEAGLDAVGALAEELIARERKRSGHKCSCGHDHEHGHECYCGGNDRQ
jgi:aminoglycoside/choline kinase family phosphotransferase/dTDP-glucose pyrophosphorylase